MNGRIYKILREARGLAQRAVADELGISQEMVSQIEREVRPVPPNAGDEGKVGRDTLDDHLAMGDGDDAGLLYALGRLSPDDELALIEPVAAVENRDTGDAAAELLAAIGYPETVVVPVRPSLIQERDGEVLDGGEDVLLRVTEYLRAIEPHDRERVVFDYRDLLAFDDPVARWITVVGLAWNDLEVANRRLITGLSAHGPHRQNFRDSRVVAACVWEISEFLRESDSEDNFPEVIEFIGRLPADVRKDYRDALAPTDPDGGDAWFRTKLVKARDKASHYPALGRRDLKTALRKLANEKGSIEAGGRFSDVRADFADDVAVNLFFASDPHRWQEEFERFVEQLREAVLPLLRFLWSALAAYLQQHPGTWKRE
jgi:transcriptional regulator with XRE-family HTH domain